jgi:hypothetical protein
LTPSPPSGLGVRRRPVKHDAAFWQVALTARTAGFLLLTVSSSSLLGQQPKFHTSAPPPILDEAAPHSSGAGFTGTEGLTNLPPGAFQADRPGISQATLFRNTQFPNTNIGLPQFGPSVRTESTTVDYKISLPSLNAGVPFFERGFEPQNAESTSSRNSPNSSGWRLL